MKFLLVYLFVFVCGLSVFANNKLLNNRVLTNIIYVCLIVVLAILFGTKPLSDFPDTLVYKTMFTNALNDNYFIALKYSSVDIGYTSLQWLITRFTGNYELFFSIIFLMFFLSLSQGFKIISNDNYLFAMLALMCTPMFSTLAGNIIRTGLAFSFFFWGINLLYKQQKKKGVILLVVSTSMHLSLVPLAITLIFVNLKTIKYKSLIFLWILSSLIFFLNVQTRIFPFLNSFEKISTYSSQDMFNKYSSLGQRWDFYLFNMVLIIILILLNNYVLKKSDDLVDNYIKITILSGVIFNILGFISFSDRIAIYVWLFFFITLIISILKLNKKYPFTLPLFLILCILFSLLTKTYIFFNEI